MDAPRYFTPEKERSLIRAAQSGDQAARDELVLGALPFIGAALRRRYPTADEQDFEDLVQEAIPPVIKCIDRYDLAHPTQARLYVFAAGDIHKAVCEFYRHASVLSYCDVLPEVASPQDPAEDLDSVQIARITLEALSTLELKEQDVLISRLGGNREVTRRELAARYRCALHVIRHDEKNAIARFLAALPLDRMHGFAGSVN